MLFNLLAPSAHSSHLANLFTYITFRSVLAIVLSLVITWVIGPKIIRYLRTIQKHGQPIRDDGPQSHFSKAGTPTMGGLMIIGATFFTTVLLANLANPYVWIVLFVLISFGALGFLDDYKKVSKNNYKGISGKTKLVIQSIVSFVACLAIMYFTPTHSTTVSFPFFKTLVIDLGYFYLPFVMIVIIGSSNAVNLTDGLDGLAIGTIIIATSAFAIICYLVGNSIYSGYLQITHVSQVGELTVLCAAIIGSGLGFLWYNSQPAEVFMGDTGSLGLGGAIGTISVITRHELVLCIIGGIFVIETLSVIIQVAYFKRTGGKRIFLMAPIHHHFEKKGWPESKVVIRFWILAIIFALIGLSSLKLR
ncbi:MAG: phospho-N-acetylmuramoyl-pentapeptide-transferase [Rickettsiales bacterium]|nr:phospho-N-acetylmuramoyl-pentapeptide-transferase [Rickettsiales bacterium]MCA0254424.1 phospho-N-acetylmuramoyl-pentapeptide-transferase [Pseudomonadota bacterium]